MVLVVVDRKQQKYGDGGEGHTTEMVVVEENDRNVMVVDGKLIKEK